MNGGVELCWKWSPDCVATASMAPTTTAFGGGGPIHWHQVRLWQQAAPACYKQQRRHPFTDNFDLKTRLSILSLLNFLKHRNNFVLMHARNDTKLNRSAVLRNWRHHPDFWRQAPRRALNAWLGILRLLLPPRRQQQRCWEFWNLSLPLFSPVRPC